MLNRRSIMGVFAGAPLFGQAVAEQAVSSAFGPDVLPPPNYPSPSSGQAGACATNTPTPPRMERGRALQMIFGDPDALAEIRAELYAEQRNIQTLDIDIMVMKSWSMMAKVTFQRQRNVERALADLQNERMDRPGYYIRAVSDRLQKLMWG